MRGSSNGRASLTQISASALQTGRGQAAAAVQQQQQALVDQQLLVLQAGEPTTTETGCCLQGGVVEAAAAAAAAVVVVVEAEVAAGEGEAVAGTLSGCQMEQIPTGGKKETLGTGSLSSRVNSSRVSSSIPGATSSSSSRVGSRRSRSRSTQGAAVCSRRGSSVLVMARSCSSQSVVLWVAGGAGTGSTGAEVQRVLAEELVMTCCDVL